MRDREWQNIGRVEIVQLRTTCVRVKFAGGLERWVPYPMVGISTAAARLPGLTLNNFTVKRRWYERNVASAFAR